MLQFDFKHQKSYQDITKTLFIIDILYMKDINALYGFKNGDYIIQQVGDLLKSSIKRDIKNILSKKVPIEFLKSHVDVFSIQIYKDIDIDTIQKIKDTIFENIVVHEFKLLNVHIDITIDVTIGCSKSDDDKLKIYAEKALHNAKLNYTNFMYFDAKLYANELLSINLLKIMKTNIDKQMVEPFYQAIVNNRTLEVTKYEALMRLYDEEGNIIMPGAFLNQSKKYRLYSKLMLLMIDKVLTHVNLYKIHVSINLDFNDILNPLIKKRIISKLQKHNIGKYLTIEILESEKIRNYDLVNDFIQEIKKYNVKIAIDDFGTGFSNYEYILKLNVDYIKIDGSLIQKINVDIYRNLIKSISLFCKQEKIKVIAEFVSDIKIFRYVNSLQIEYSQGYYFSQPKPIDKILGERNEG